MTNKLTEDQLAKAEVGEAVWLAFMEKFLPQGVVVVESREWEE